MSAQVESNPIRCLAFEVFLGVLVEGEAGMFSAVGVCNVRGELRVEDALSDWSLSSSCCAVSLLKIKLNIITN